MKVELCNIKKYFGNVRANDGVSLTVEPGSIHGLLGENGAGKSTLMKILSGYLKRDGGEVILDGEPVNFVSPLDALRRGIGMLHQDPLDFPPLSALDNFMLGRNGPLWLSRGQARRELMELGTRLGFRLDLDTPVRSLTVGERQQLEIVRLLSFGIEVLILDEPTTGISATQKEELFRTLHKLAREESRSVIFVSHKLEEVQELCDRVTVLRRGRVAGEVEIPCPNERLVRLMFGQELRAARRESLPLGEPVLELEGVNLHTYRLTVKDVSLRVRAGEVIGVAGLEGSGQRLLLRAAVGLLRPRRGRVRLGRQDMTGRPYHHYLAAGAAYLPASRLEEGLIKGLTLEEHFVLKQPRPSFFVNRAQARRLAEGKIKAFDIRGQPETPVESLSGGNQQRALLALLPDDLKLLVLEHPTRGLDIESAMWVWEQLLARRRRGTAIIFTSSDLDELVEHSDRIVVFSGGRMSAPLDAGRTTREELGYLIGGVMDEGAR